jgi:hypothetical protein
LLADSLSRVEPWEAEIRLPSGRDLAVNRGTTRVLLATTPVDLRASFNRLYVYVAEILREDSRSGHWFVFTTKDGLPSKIWILMDRAFGF